MENLSNEVAFGVCVSVMGCGKQMTEVGTSSYPPAEAGLSHLSA